ncbi:MAG: nitrate reductase subunit beta [Acidimicrobiia bacterium]|nr:nitrate reductase subunit beta [Acidimicrobiia bacterium]
MRVRAQFMMVMALDKCIGCHTCSTTCKQAWTNRTGTDYVWFNNVETKPGIGYPKHYEDQNRWNGGWTLNRRGRLKLKSGGRIKKLMRIFANPDLPTIDDYYEPWSYDYASLTNAPKSDRAPVATAHSRLTGEEIDLQWGPNWEDDLGGAHERYLEDPNMRGLEEQITLDYENVFLMYLPRICEHCMNPSCVASCPSGAMYKREEDGIVLVDQNKCRGWRFCVSGCPYKKVYFNHVTSKAEKCTFCYARVEDGEPTVCSETCVGRIRYIGIVLYDLDAVTEVAATTDEQDLIEAHRDLFLDPHDPEVIAAAEVSSVPHDWIEAAGRSPVYALAKDLGVAFPLHPEYRTLPMVWYVPPLSPVVDAMSVGGYDAERPEDVFAAIEHMRIPVDYLANLLTAGDAKPVETALRRLTAMRAFKREEQLTGAGNESLAADVGLRPDQLEHLFRLLALAPYDERYVIPTSHREETGARQSEHCSIDFPGGPDLAATFGLEESNMVMPEADTSRDEDGRVRLNVREAPPR